jgi:hypothetical protein
MKKAPVEVNRNNEHPREQGKAPEESIMIHMDIPARCIKTRPVNFEDRSTLLDHWQKDLALMEDQYRAAENIDVPSKTLKQWFEDLEQQRNLVDRLRKELAENPHENSELVWERN